MNSDWLLGFTAPIFSMFYGILFLVLKDLFCIFSCNFQFKIRPSSELVWTKVAKVWSILFSDQTRIFLVNIVLAVNYD